MTFKIRAILIGLVGFLCCGALPTHAAGHSNDATLVYVGTFTGTPAKSKGIYLFRLEPGKNGSPILTPLGVAAETPSPTFLALDAKRHLLFCVNEMNSFAGKKTGAVSAFSIDPATGQLKFINQRSSMGPGPCHLVLDHTGKYVLVANYAGGSVAVLPVAADGALGEATCFIQHAGKGPNPTRQEGPHAHCAAFSPDNRFAFVCDLGLDKVMIYKFDAGTGKLTPDDPPFASLAPGSGPRHILFHPNGKFAYVITELASTITTFAYDANNGALKELQTLSTLPADFHGKNTAAEIAIAPSGKFLFASNRGNDTIASFAIDPKTGTLRWLGAQSTEGKTPRHFAIDTSGRELLIENQDSNSLVLKHIDAVAGKLTSIGSPIPAPAPVCAVFLPMKAK
ncbi:MAG TPA: lactonase family protein [Candidatus Angelobacter sp.]|nr:lactonase family protein [Candidatus Angelobacter sp.]